MDEFRLKWQTHVPILCQEFGQLLTQETHVDVTLVCHNGKVRAHRLILSSSSPLFESVLASEINTEATIIIPDIDVQVLRTLIDYIYRGEIAVQDSELQALVAAATLLQVRGIALASPQSQNQLNASIQSSMPGGLLVAQNLNNSLLSSSATFPVRSLMARKFVRTKRKIAADKVSPQKRHLSLNSEKRELFADEVTKDSTCDSAYANVTRSECQEESQSTKEATNSSDVQQNLNATNSLHEPDSNVIREPADGVCHAEMCPAGATVKSEDTSSLSDTDPVPQDVELDANGNVTAAATKPLAQLKTENGVLSDTATPADKMASPDSNNMAATDCDKMASPENGLDSTPTAVDYSQCVFCKKHFLSTSQLREHISSVHVADRLEKQFKCDFCPAAFARSAHLKRHVRTHTGEKPYACSLCPRAFSRQDKLKCHMDRHTGVVAGGGGDGGGGDDNTSTTATPTKRNTNNNNGRSQKRKNNKNGSKSGSIKTELNFGDIMSLSRALSSQLTGNCLLPSAAATGNPGCQLLLPPLPASTDHSADCTDSGATNSASLSPATPATTPASLNTPHHHHHHQSLVASSGGGGGCGGSGGGVSVNPSLPYLQHILDDVQIVRDKKPASYYRQMKRQILNASGGGIIGGGAAAAAAAAALAAAGGGGVGGAFSSASALGLVAGGDGSGRGAVAGDGGLSEQLLRAVRRLGECTIKLAAAPAAVE